VPVIFTLQGFTKGKRNCVEENTMATLKSKQTSIASVRNHLQTVASLLTPPHFSLHTNLKDAKKILFLFFANIVSVRSINL
jgi:hypothetical protein